MAKFQIQSEIDTHVLLTSVAQMPVNELEFFVQELNALITRRKAQDKARRERALLGKINQTVLSKDKMERYIWLHHKLEADRLTDIEHKEFMDLVAQEEEKRNERVKFLIELAQLKAVSLPQLMLSLGLNSPISHG
jgi:hypothetical protein